MKGKSQTKHIWANTHECKACWKCVGTCSGQVIGKICIFWHKHIVFRNSENCIGCKKCIETCPHGVFVQSS
jgi:2-oxoglutarate ferredoxin oxidoreductase subunit delta